MRVTHNQKVAGSNPAPAGGSGASVELTGASSASTMANSSGVYSFTGLQNGSYTIAPSNEGYVMTPASQAVLTTAFKVSNELTRNDS